MGQYGVHRAFHPIFLLVNSAFLLPWGWERKERSRMDFQICSQNCVLILLSREEAQGFSPPALLWQRVVHPLLMSLGQSLET